MSEIVRRIRMTPSNSYLGNPHKGCCTFQHFNGDALFPGVSWSEEGPVAFPPAVQLPVIDGYLPTTVAYCRWFWPVLEAQKGQYDFSVIDNALRTCQQRGQTLAVRLMAFGSSKQPQVPDWYIEKCPTVVQTAKSHSWRIPVHDSPEYLEHWGGLVSEFARRYDGHPLLESIDVTYIGPWGEGAGECSAQQCENFAALWKRAFKTTLRLGLIGGIQMAEAVKSGAGWRCDCFGDLSENGSLAVSKHVSFNHHFDCYPQQICDSGATDTWKTAPVHFETCWVPMHWYRKGWDLDFIIEQGLKFHGTYFMPKYTRLPEAWMDKLAAFCRKLGYRFILRQAIFDRRVKLGESLSFQSWIENVGVAPIYRRYYFALHFRQGDTVKTVTLDNLDITKWLPGDVSIKQQVSLPEGLQRGWVELSAGLIDRESGEARVKFAVKESFSDGFVHLEGFEIV